jgi:hypothetical protein
MNEKTNVKSFSINELHRNSSPKFTGFLIKKLHSLQNAAQI